MAVFNEDEKQQVIIGEAAMNLILTHNDVSVGSLINQLRAMASSESDGDRLGEIVDARNWLLDFKKSQRKAPSGADWLSSSLKHSNPLSEAADISISVSADTDRSDR